MIDKLFLVLLLLLGITLFSWALVALAILTPEMLGAALLVLAFVKVYVILQQYMELSAAATVVRFGFRAWVCLTGAMTLGMYLQ
jgi:membrane-bound ClpP family serine protease